MGRHRDVSPERPLVGRVANSNTNTPLPSEAATTTNDSSRNKIISSVEKGLGVLSPLVVHSTPLKAAGGGCMMNSINRIGAPTSHLTSPLSHCHVQTSLPTNGVEARRKTGKTHVCFTKPAKWWKKNSLFLLLLLRARRHQFQWKVLK